MGWAAVLTDNTHVFTLHSERGWVDIYLGRLNDKLVLASKSKPEEIIGVIREKLS